MSGEKSLQSLVAELEKLEVELQNPDNSIEDIFNAASDALSVHRKFKSAYGGSTFEVQTVQADPEGKISRKPFDWKLLG